MFSKSVDPYNTQPRHPNDRDEESQLELSRCDERGKGRKEEGGSTDLEPENSVDGEVGEVVLVL